LALPSYYSSEFAAVAPTAIQAELLLLLPCRLAIEYMADMAAKMYSCSWAQLQPWDCCHADALAAIMLYSSGEFEFVNIATTAAQSELLVYIAATAVMQASTAILSWH